MQNDKTENGIGNAKPPFGKGRWVEHLHQHVFDSEGLYKRSKATNFINGFSHDTSVTLDQFVQFLSRHMSTAPFTKGSLYHGQFQTNREA